MEIKKIEMCWSWHINVLLRLLILCFRQLKLHDAAVFRFSGEIDDDGNTPKTYVILLYVNGRNTLT